MKKNQQTKKRKKIVYDLICCKEYQPMRAKELAVLLQVPAGKREELHKILDMLLEEGKKRAHGSASGPASKTAFCIRSAA